MDIIQDIAREFIEENYLSSDNMNFFLSGIKSELSRHRKSTDKVQFLSYVRNMIQGMNDEHFKSCKNREDCDDLKWHAKSILYINNMLEDYSIPINQENIFSEEEVKNYSEKLDKIISEIETLKMGQEIIYDGISEEIEELKKMYYLGKKNWKQLLAGKALEMIAGGVVSEMVSKELINVAEIAKQNFLP